MNPVHHSLLSPSLGSHKTLSSFHFGQRGVGPKVYIQASLHAEELPGMLTAHHLRKLLDDAQSAGLIKGEIVLVPVANPIGLAQRLDHKPMGRFELDTSENFNRHYPDLAQAVWPMVVDNLGQNAQTNIALLRLAVGKFLGEWIPKTELESLRRTLLLLSFDADWVLDLHCDCEGVVHFYTEEACWPQFDALAHYLGCEAILLAKNSGSRPFDECLSGLWWQLADRLQTAGYTVPLPQGGCSTTIELRGEADVNHRHALTDAKAIFSWLQHQNIIDGNAPEVPPAKCQATPLAGSETLRAPAPGIVVFAAQVGTLLKAGDLVVEIIDPITNRTHRVVAGVSGILYGRIRDRYITTGGELGKIASNSAFRTGELLGA